MNHPIFFRLTVLCVTILWGAGSLLGQVNSAEETLKNRATNVAPAAKPVQESPAEAKDANDALVNEAMGTLNAEGYFALFKSLRTEALSRSQYQIPLAKQQQLDQVVDKMELAFPQSFEYHYAAYLNSNNDTSMGYHLLEAHRLAPEKTILYHDMVAFYELSSDGAKKVEFCKKIDQKKVYDPQLYQYGRNLFKSLEPGSIVFTQGEWDTYPLWVLQHVHHVRTDVTILQLDLLHQQHYFNRKMAPFKLKKGAYQRFINDKPGFFKELAASGSKQQVYLALTLDQSIISPNSNILYNTGLAMKLSIKPIENLTTLVKNWQTFDLSFINTTSANPDLNKMTGNYILPMGMLYQKAIEAGHQQEAEKMKQQMLNVAKKAGKLKEMEEYFK